MEALILAAGSGRRLSSVHNQAKCLVELGTRRLIDLILANIQALQPSHITLVGPADPTDIQNYLNHKWPSVQLLTNQVASKGNVTTVLAAKSFINDGFLLCNADHAYDLAIYETIQRAISQHSESLLAMCDFDRRLTDDDMKVKLDQGRVSQIAKTLQEFDAGYVGMTYVPGALKEEYFKIAQTLLDEQGDAVCVEQILQRFADQGTAVNICDISGHHWFEVDTPEDLVRAREVMERYSDDFSFFNGNTKNHK